MIFRYDRLRAFESFPPVSRLCVGKGEDAHPGVFSLQELGATGDEGGPRGGHIVYQEQMLAPDGACVFKAEGILHILIALPAAFMGLAFPELRAAHDAFAHQDARNLADAPGYLRALVEAPLAEPVFAQGQGNEQVDILEKTGIHELRGHLVPHFPADFRMSVILHLVDDVAGLAARIIEEESCAPLCLHPPPEHCGHGILVWVFVIERAGQPEVAFRADNVLARSQPEAARYAPLGRNQVQKTAADSGHSSMSLRLSTHFRMMSRLYPRAMAHLMSFTERS